MDLKDVIVNGHEGCHTIWNLKNVIVNGPKGCHSKWI